MKRAVQFGIGITMDKRNTCAATSGTTQACGTRSSSRYSDSSVSSAGPDEHRVRTLAFFHPTAWTLKTDLNSDCRQEKLLTITVLALSYDGERQPDDLTLVTGPMAFAKCCTIAICSETARTAAGPTLKSSTIQNLASSR
ncbi:hypothetical protein Mapa_009936 [Marchantia paleacea]|nr:hypothetical protein Mapa_009936 [Marchantia paleacea]